MINRYKAVNMNKFRFGRRANKQYIGFGILDTDKNAFISIDGVDPYVLSRKRYFETILHPEILRKFDLVSYAAKSF